jgi:hypothetical protein
MTVVGFLSGQAKIPQPSHLQRIDAISGHTSEMAIEPAIHRACSGQRHLLLKDDPDKGRKAGAASPEGRFAQLIEDTGEIGVLGPQRPSALAERGTGESPRKMGQRVCFY